MCLVTQGPKRHTKPGCSFVSWGSFFCVWVYVVFCFVLFSCFWLSVPVQSIARKDLSLK